MCPVIVARLLRVFAVLNVRRLPLAEQKSGPERKASNLGGLEVGAENLR